jgi:hypothetical protein
MKHTSRKLSRRLTALGLAIVASLAFAGLAAGSASALSMTPTTNEHFGTGGVFYFAPAGSATKSCTSSSSSGKALTATTGEIKITFKGCNSPFAPCTSSGQASGTITTGNLNYQLVYLDAAKTKFGLMLIPPDAQLINLPPPFDGNNGKVDPSTGTFATFVCTGWSYKWIGSILGQITKPALNVAASQVTLEFATTGGLQRYTTIEGAKSPSYGLKESKAGGSATNMPVEGTETLQFIKNTTFLP